VSLPLQGLLLPLPRQPQRRVRCHLLQIAYESSKITGMILGSKGLLAIYFLGFLLPTHCNMQTLFTQATFQGFLCNPTFWFTFEGEKGDYE
jgi:hypothetical protein